MKKATIFLLILFCSLHLYSRNKVILMPYEGTVTYSTDGNNWKQAGKKVIFEKTVYVKTGKYSRAAIFFPGECTIKLIEDSFVKLENKNIFIFRGSTWFKVVKKKRKFNISTKSVLVGVWGTEFEIEVDEPDNNFLVYEGTIGLDGKSKKKSLKLTSGYIISSKNGFFKSRKRLLSNSQLQRVRGKWLWDDDENLGAKFEKTKEHFVTTEDNDDDKFVESESIDKDKNEVAKTKSGAQCYITGTNPDISTAFGPDCNRTRFSSQCNTITRSGAACTSHQSRPPTPVPTPEPNHSHGF